MVISVHPRVAGVVQTYLEQVEDAAPGLLEGLYVVGSVAMEDFRRGGLLTRYGPSGAGSSDIDVVALTLRPVRRSDLPALERVHRRVARRHPRPVLEGLYLTRADLGRDPTFLGDHARVHAGRVRFDAQAASPVTWHELAGHGVRVHGPHPGRLGIWTDREVLRTWCRANLQDYWRGWHRRSASVLTGPGLACLTPFAPAWAVLGTSRSYFTATTGQLVSKTGAGQYAREAFDPRWRRIIEESLRIRTSSGARPLYGNPVTRRTATLDYVAMVVEAGAGHG